MPSANRMAGVGPILSVKPVRHLSRVPTGDSPVGAADRRIEEFINSGLHEAARPASAKDREVMSAKHLGLLCLISVGVFLSGCYSNGRWTMPNFAFWKSSDAAKSESASPEAVAGDSANPTRPSQLAGSGQLPPPGAGLTSPSSAVPNTAGVGQYPYPSTASTPTASRAPVGGYPGATSSVFIQPQQGVYPTTPPSAGAGGYAATGYPAVPSTANASPDPRAAIAPVNQPATGYPAVGSASGPAAHMASNPVRSSAPAAGTINASPAINASNEYRPPMPPSGGYTPSSGAYAPTQPVAAPPSSTYLPPAPNVPTNPHALSPSAAIGPTASPASPGDPNDAGVARSAANVAPVSYTPPGLPARGNDYVPAANSYQPGNNGYNPPGAAPYSAPTAPYVSPSGASYAPAAAAPSASSDNGYRPGGTSDYVPRRPAAGDPQAAPSYQAVDANVRPAGYLR